MPSLRLFKLFSAYNLKHHSLFAFTICLFALLSACSAPSDTPDSAVERYLEAIVSVDDVGAVNAACAAWEQQALLESAAYQGVETQLENLDCQVVSQSDGSAVVACDGQVRYSYAGGEDQLDELGGRTFSALVEGGEWKACGPGGEVETFDVTATAEPVVHLDATATPEATVEPTPELSPTPDTRPLPADWRAWPIVPELSPWLKDVYTAGLAAGNDPTHFSVAGDCQNIPEAFLGFYDDAERYSFPEGEDYLQETVDYFAGSWNRDGLAVDGGYNFPAIFTALRADPELCNAGEPPLACEIRTYRPSFMFISMEFVYEGRTAANYEQYLRETVDYVLSQNVIPILLTKADNVEGNHGINLATAQVAYDYDIPLINWWRAAQPLEGHGLDLDRDAGKRPEGFHITYESWGVRSYWALVTLDAFRQALQ